MTKKDTFGRSMMPVKSYEYQLLHRNYSIINPTDTLEDMVRDLQERPQLCQALCKTIVKLEENYEKYINLETNGNFEAVQKEAYNHERLTHYNQINILNECIKNMV